MNRCFEKSETTAPNDVEEVPSAPQITNPANAKLVFFDLETTGLARTSDIVQISAVCGAEEFNVYIKPDQLISPGASAVTGLAVVGGVLRYNGEPVPTTTIDAALTSFLEFVQCYERPVLVGHNIQAFDVPVLFNQLKALKMTAAFRAATSGFMDTLKVAKQKIKKDELPGKSYRQENLVKTLLNKEYAAHNALADISILQELYSKKLSLEPAEINQNLFSLDYYVCVNSLASLVKAKVITDYTKQKLARCSLGLPQLKLVYSRDPEQGIAAVFAEPGPCKKPLITKSKAAINKVNQYLATV